MKTKQVLPLTGLLLIGFALLYSGLLKLSTKIAEQPAPAAIRPDLQPEKPVPIIPLLMEDKTEPVVWESRTPAAVRAQTIEPDSSLLTAMPSLKEGDRIQLALFDDAVVEGLLSDVTVYPNGSVGMTAQLDNGFRGHLYLAYSGGELRASVDVFGGNDFYVRYDPDQQQHIAIEVDRAASDYDGKCGACEPEGHLADAMADEIDPVPLSIPSMSEDAPVDTTVLDVMVVYTPAALAYEGGTNGMNNNITLAMQRANTAHGNSDTKVTLNLVHSAETAYVESGDSSLDLRRLTFAGSTNSAMDEVQGWRDTYSADFICLFEDDPEVGGRGWLLTSESGRPDLAFCLARVQQTDWSYTMVHEWGHNMGCSHSKTQTLNAWKAGDLYSFSAGWQWSDTGSSASVGYCSIMTYQNFDGSGSDDEYERIPHFSNPSINYTDDSTNPTGHAADGDNARTIREMRHVLSEYRISNMTISSFPSSNDFEQGYSPWRYYTGSARWEREDGSDVNLVNNAPNIATTNAASGDYFLYIDGVEFQNNETAILEATFDFSDLQEPFIRFSYCMYSYWGVDAVNTLQVSTNNGASWSALWINSGEPDNNWRLADIDLSAFSGVSDVKLRFKTDLGILWYKNYACIDDILVSGTSDLDIDSDGIPNDWETLYFGGPTNALATANPDFDTYNNLQEYIAGLNPTNSDSFGPSNLTSGVNNAFEWAPASGRVYSVYWSSNLLDGFSILQSNLTSGAYTDAVHSTEAQGFYRLEVELAP